MAEQKQDKGVPTDKEKFEENPAKDKIGHMGDKPGQAPDQKRPSPKK